MYLNKVRNTNRDEAYILINNLTKFKYNTWVNNYKKTELIARNLRQKACLHNFLNSFIKFV